MYIGIEHGLMRMEVQSHDRQGWGIRGILMEDTSVKESVYSSLCADEQKYMLLQSLNVKRGVNREWKIVITRPGTSNSSSV